jgi:hypothetical protein
MTTDPFVKFNKLAKSYGYAIFSENMILFHGSPNSFDAINNNQYFAIDITFAGHGGYNKNSNLYTYKIIKPIKLLLTFKYENHKEKSYLTKIMSQQLNININELIYLDEINDIKKNKHKMGELCNTLNNDYDGMLSLYDTSHTYEIVLFKPTECIERVYDNHYLIYDNCKNLDDIGRFMAFYLPYDLPHINRNDIIIHNCIYEDKKWYYKIFHKCNCKCYMIDYIYLRQIFTYNNTTIIKI